MATMAQQPMFVVTPIKGRTRGRSNLQAKPAPPPVAAHHAPTRADRRAQRIKAKNLIKFLNKFNLASHTGGGDGVGVGDFKRYTKNSVAPDLDTRPEWIGSPSSYANFTFSSTVNHRIHNRQDIPDCFQTGAPAPVPVKREPVTNPSDTAAEDDPAPADGSATMASGAGEARVSISSTGSMMVDIVEEGEGEEEVGVVEGGARPESVAYEAGTGPVAPPITEIAVQLAVQRPAAARQERVGVEVETRRLSGGRIVSMVDKRMANAQAADTRSVGSGGSWASASNGPRTRPWATQSQAQPQPTSTRPRSVGGGRSARGRRSTTENAAWVGSPSSFKKLPFSKGCMDQPGRRNLQDVPALVDLHEEVSSNDQLIEERPPYIARSDIRLSALATNSVARTLPVQEQGWNPSPVIERHDENDIYFSTLHKPVVESPSDARTEMVASLESGWVGTPSTCRQLSYSKTANEHLTNIQDIPAIEKPPHFSVPPLSLVQERLDIAHEEVRLQQSRGLAPKAEGNGFSRALREAALARGTRL